MRKFRLDFTQDNPCLDGCCLGRIGEHNATELIITPPAEVTRNEAVTSYIIAFVTDGKIIHSKPFDKDETLSVPLWKQLTMFPVLGVQLEAYDDEGEYIGKSGYISGLRFLPSVGGDETAADTENPDFISEFLKTKHGHNNLGVLDKFSEDKEGKPLYNGESIGGQNVDMTGYAKTEDIPTKTSELDNDSGFITADDLPEVNTGGGAALRSKTYINGEYGEVTTGTTFEGSIDFITYENPDDENPIPENAVIVDFTLLYEGTELGMVDLALYGLISTNDCIKLYPVVENEFGIIAQIVNIDANASELARRINNGETPITAFTVYYLDTSAVSSASGGDVGAKIEAALAEAKASGEFDGADGSSAYQIWLNAGNTGTEADFLASLKGKNGADGADGISPLLNITDIAGGHKVEFADLTGTHGFDVMDGKDGANGKDGYSPIKGTDYFTEADKAEMVEEVTAAFEGDIPDYWQTAIDEGVSAVNQAIENAGQNKSAFLFYTDAHWGYGSTMSPKLLKYLYENTAINKVNFGGDFCNTYGITGNDYMSKMREWRKAVRNLPNHHSVIGNHDEDIAELTSEAQRYGFLLAPEETNDVVRGDYFHYYIDSQPEKTRYIYLDTGLLGVSPYKVSDKSSQFTVDTLNSTPEGWHIAVISHIWFEYDSTDNPTVGTIPAYCQGLLDMFDAYNARSNGSITPNETAVSYDFTNAKAKVEFCVGGHIHVDHVVTSVNKIPVIMCQTDSYHCRGDYTATAGTTTEASVSGIIANYDSDKLTVVRVGRGNSFDVVLSTGEVTEFKNGDNENEPSTPSYTNVLETVGYTKGIYLSNGAETADANAYSTGFIPVPYNNVNAMIYLKNINMPDESSHGNRVACYDADKNYINGTCFSLTSSASASRNAAWDKNSNLTQFNVGYVNVSYVRISAWLIDENSIITVDEPIE